MSNTLNGQLSQRTSYEQDNLHSEFIPISIKDILSDKLILAVKIKEAFKLDMNDSRIYDFYTKDDRNLKSRTLGNWKVNEQNSKKIVYIIGVSTGGNNEVVSAYKVSGTQRELDEKGKYRVFFQTESNREDTLRELGLYHKSLRDIKFGSGQAIKYINS